MTLIRTILSHAGVFQKPGIWYGAGLHLSEPSPLKPSLTNVPRWLLIYGLTSSAVLTAQVEEPMESAIAFADSQMRATLSDMGYGPIGTNPDWVVSVPDLPKVTDADTGDISWGFQSRAKNWGAGFTPGLMWDLYELTDDPYWLEKAGAFTDGIEVLQTAGGDMRMNMGFHMMNSYARRIALDPASTASDSAIIATGAGTLLDSWMPAVGSLWSFSWSRGERFDGLQGGWAANKNTIIDSAPNLEVLFYQAKRAGDAAIWDKAISHLNNLVRDNIRPDGSTAQLASYDTDTGELLRLCGHQGYSFETTWSRGQGWALHGFATAWRETRDKAVGEVFHDLYLYYRDNCPADGVPYWDFDAPDLTDAELEFRYPEKGAPALRYERDTSAAALTASALMLASELAETAALREEYFLYGLHILKSLSTPGYLARDALGNPVKESILGQGAYTFPGVDKGQIWGDFFFVEALRRYQQLVEPVSVFYTTTLGDLQNYAMWEPFRWKVVSDDGSRALRLQGGTVTASLPANMALYRLSTFGDFTFSFSFRADELLLPASPVDAVFVFDYADAENFSFIRFSTDSGSSAVIRVDNGTPLTVASLGQAWSTRTYQEVTLNRTGDTLQVEVNGDLWAFVQDPLIAQTGFLGLGGMGHSLLFSRVGAIGSGTAAELSPRAAWRVARFSHPLSILAADGMDPDRDGRENLMEYAMGSPPLAAGGEAPGLALSNPAPGLLELAFPYNESYLDINYKLMRSVDGGLSWSPVESVAPSGSGSWATATHGSAVQPDATLYRLEIIPVY